MADLNASRPKPELRAFFYGIALLLLPGCPGDTTPIGETEGTTGSTTAMTSIATFDTCAEGTGGCTVTITTLDSSGTSLETASTGGSTGSTDSTGSTGGTTGTTDTTDDTTGTTGGESSSSGTTEGLSVGSSSSSDGGMDTGVVFLVEPDGGPGIECNTYLQDCPVGQKCMPWDNIGGGSWNALGCFPVDPAPVGEGEVCTVQGSGTSGIDDCALGHMCWDVDAVTNEGTCVAMCTGSEVAPVCGPPGTTCVISNDGVLNLCLPGCSPLLQDCPGAQGCYPVGDLFTCAPDASGAMGVDGDECAFINVCDPGLMCIGGGAVEACFSNCCTPFCDVSLPGDPCPAVTEECVPFYSPGLAPPGFEDVGVCAIP
jgi:hypothetical protein